MEPSGTVSSDQKKRKEEKVQPPSCGLLALRLSRSRFLSCLMIAGLFLILDLAILFYFVWLPSNKDVEQVSSGPAVVEKNNNTSAVQDDLQQKD